MGLGVNPIYLKGWENYLLIFVLPQMCQGGAGLGVSSGVSVVSGLGMRGAVWRPGSAGAGPGRGHRGLQARASSQTESGPGGGTVTTSDRGHQPV